MITVHYKCKCMQDEGSLQMRARGPLEDIKEFMERLQMNLGVDHHARNPACTSDKVEYVKFHVPGDGAPHRIGTES